MLIHDYELFKIESHEFISEMFSRFTNIINVLKSLGKSYINVELTRKLLRSLQKNWESKVTTIQEAKDLTRLSMEQLLGSLMTHEFVMMNGSKKKIKATSGDDDECCSDEENNNNEVAKLCLMAFGDDDEVCGSNDESFTCDELQTTFDELHAEFKKLSLKSSCQKKIISSL